MDLEGRDLAAAVALLARVETVERVVGGIIGL